MLEAAEIPPPFICRGCGKEFERNLPDCRAPAAACTGSDNCPACGQPIPLASDKEE